MFSFGVQYLYDFVERNPAFGWAYLIAMVTLVLFYPYSQGRITSGPDSDMRYGMGIVCLCATLSLFTAGCWMAFNNHITEGSHLSTAQRAEILADLTVSDWSVSELSDDARRPTANMKIFEGCIIALPLENLDGRWTPVVYLTNGRDEIGPAALSPSLYQDVESCDAALSVTP